jgi:hypothetical protein
MIFTLVATVKDEGPYLWEWVAYHRMIGFNNIIIFQNDSSDGTHEILSEMQKHELIVYKYNRAKRGGHQVQAYKRAARQQEYLQADFAMALDLDEFLLIHTGNGTLTDFMKATSDFDCAYINWRKFGSSHRETPTDELVTAAFLRCAPQARIKTSVEPFKSLYRRAAYSRPGIHQPVSEKDPTDNLKIINGSGLDSSAFTVRNFQCSDPRMCSLAQVNHYIVKDVTSFVLKSYKGSAHQANRAIDQKYWKGRNNNREEDTRMLARQELLHSEMHRINQMTGGKLLDLTAKARSYHASAFQQAIANEWAKELFAFCAAHND